MAKSTLKKIQGEEARSIGRPGHESATVGREALIEATCELLKQMPPRKMTRATVARHTGVHPSLIRYYFKNVHVLLIEAAKLFNAKLVRKVELLTSKTDSSPEARLRVRIGALIDLIAEYPYYQRLIVEEILESDDPEARTLMERMTERGVDSYREIVESGVRQGVFREIDVKLLFATVIGLAEFQTTAHALVHLPERRDRIGNAFRETYTDFVCEMVLRSLRLSPRASSAA